MKDSFFNIVLGLFFIFLGIYWHFIETKILSRIDLFVLQYDRYELLFILVGISFFVVTFIRKKHENSIYLWMKRINEIKWINYFFFILVALIIVIMYYPTMNLFFYGDDFLFFHDVMSFDNKSFSDFFVFDNYTGSMFFNPISYIRWYIVYKYIGLNPLYFHIESIILYVIFIYLHWIILGHFISNNVFKYVAILLLALNTASWEHIGFLTADELWIINPLIPVLFFLQFRKTHLKIWYYLSLLFMFTGIFTSSWIAIVPILLLLYDLFFFNLKSTLKNRILTISKVHIWYWLMLILFVIFRRLYLPIDIPEDSPYEIVIGTNLFTNFLVYFMLAWDIPFFEHAASLNHLFVNNIAVSIFTSVTILFIVIYLFYRIYREENKQLRNTFYYFFLWVPINIVIVLFIKSGGHISEYNMGRTVFGLIVLLLMFLFYDSYISKKVRFKYKILIITILFLCSIFQIDIKRSFSRPAKNAKISENLYQQFKSAIDKEEKGANIKELVILSNSSQNDIDLQRISKKGRMFKMFSDIEKVNFLLDDHANQLQFGLEEESPNLMNEKIYFTWNGMIFKHIKGGEN